MTSAVSVREFTKRYGQHAAVDAVSYEVPFGSVCGLLGQNGAGKTTTIRCLLDLLRPSDGAIEVLGLDSRTPSASSAAYALAAVLRLMRWATASSRTEGIRSPGRKAPDNTRDRTWSTTWA